MARATKNHVQWIKWLGSDLVFRQEIIAPRLLALIDDELKARRIADSANHFDTGNDLPLMVWIEYSR